MTIYEAMRKGDDIIFVGTGNYEVGYAGGLKETFHIESINMKHTEVILADDWEVFCCENHLQEDCVDYVRFYPVKEMDLTEYMRWIIDNYDLPATNETLAPDMMDGILTYAQGLDKEDQVKFLRLTFPSFPESMLRALKSNCEPSGTQEESENPVYTHDRAAEIIEAFEDILCGQGIKIPSPEDDERGEDNEAPLYGSVYSDLLDNTEAILIEMLDEAGTENYVADEFSGNF